MDTRSKISWWGLGVYVLSVLIGFVALLFDSHQFLTGQTTITEWATAKPAREWLLVGATSLGTLGVWLHFKFFRR